MAGSFAIDSQKYAIYVKVIGGLGDGPLIWIDSNFHIHHGPDDPLRVSDKVRVALQQINAGIEALHAATADRQYAIGA